MPSQPMSTALPRGIRVLYSDFLRYAVILRLVRAASVATLRRYESHR